MSSSRFTPALVAFSVAACSAPALPGLGGDDVDDASSTNDATSGGADSIVASDDSSSIFPVDSAGAPVDATTSDSDGGVDVAIDSSSSVDAVVGPTITVACDGAACSGSKPICCGSWEVIDWSWSCDSACDLGRGYDCDDATDCTDGQVCCTSTDWTGTIAGSGCQGSCGNSDKQLCASDKECVVGKCKSFTPPDADYSLGACQ